jgi:hypothetical protein
MFTSNPEMDARALEPIDSTIDTVDVEETDTLFPIK